MFNRIYKGCLNKRLWGSLFCMLITLNAFALQEKPITNNAKVNAYIAINGLTRIAIDNDRITNVRSVANAYQLQTDNNQGAIFIHPIGAYTKKPFTLFIATENNQNYLLRLTPRNQNADTIVLEPLDAKNPDAQHWETASPYTEAITHLMIDMATNNSPEGYAVLTPIKPKKDYFGSIAIVQLAEIYNGANLQGFVYTITNRTNGAINLTESKFYQPGDRAIALHNLVVAPLGTTQLYKVTSHD